MRPAKSRSHTIVAAVIASAIALTACEKPAAPAPAGVRVGAPDSACELPVTFELTESWTPKPVIVEAGDPLAELARKGPLTMACEIDAKPAGSLGFLRVWTTAEGEPRQNLKTFIGTEAREPAFTELTIGGKPAVEVTYRKKSELDDTMEKERAFAVKTGQGVAVVSLDSFDNEEHEAMLPTYELARDSLTRSE